MLHIAEAAKEAASAVEDLQHTIDALHGTEVTIKVNTEGDLGGLGGLGARVGEAVPPAQMFYETAAAADAMAAAEEHAATVGVALGDGQRSAAGGAVAAGVAAGAAAGGFRIFGFAAGQVLHWVVAAGAEFLAVAIPATVALGAAMAVAAQGAQMVQEHMSALYTATEATANMFHVTIGSALGLHSALQQAQNTANPIVWSVLGGAINILKGNFQDLAGVGLQVMRIFQTFTASVVADFQAGFGGEIHALLSGMVTDLVEFGQILGNIGHALLNFAAAMPGLAHVLLAVADGISQVILWASHAGTLITIAMAMEEIWRWGGPLAAILTRIPGLLTALVASGFGVVPVFARIGEIFSSLLLIVPRLGVALATGLISLSEWIPALGEAGVAIGVFSEGMVAAIAGISTFGLALGGIALGGLAFLIYKMSQAKTATQQLTDSMQQTVSAASGLKVFSDISNNLGVLSARYSQVSHAAGGMVAATNNITRAEAAKDATYNSSLQTLDQLHAGMTQQQRDLLNAAQAVTFISRAYGVSFVGALELGTQAGVQWDQGIGRMSVAADINRLKVLDLMAGYKAMGQSAGAVGADMTAIAIQSGLQTSKIQQLTQAWQSYMGLLTGGTTALATFEQGIANIGTVAASSAGRLFEATGKMNSSTQQFAQSLQSFTGKGAQNWQNFNQVVTTGAEQFINWMQTAGAVGAVQGNQMAGAIKGVVAQLIPFASHSQAARAELAGLAAQTGAVVAPTNAALEAWAKGGMNAKQLGQFVQDATAKLSNMAQIAQNLGNVMQNDLVAMFDKAKIAASGLPGALNTLSNAMHTNGTSASTMQGDITQVIQRLAALHTSIPTISALLNSMGVNLSAAGVKAIIAAAGLNTTGASASRAGAQAASASGQVRALEAAIASLQSKTITITTVLQTLHIGGSSAPTRPGFQAGGTVPYSGFFQVGEAGPELAFLPQGTRVLNNTDSQRFLSNVSSPPGGTVALGGGHGGPAEAVVHNHVYLDGQQIWEGQQRQTLIYNTRNGNAQSGRVAPGSSFG